MASDALKLARLQRKREQDERLWQTLKGVASHPVVVMIGGCAAVEWLQNNVVLEHTPAVPGGFSWNPLDFGFHFGQPEKDTMLFSQALATALEVAILMWGTKTTIQNVAEVLKSLSTIPSQLAGQAASLALLAK